MSDEPTVVLIVPIVPAATGNGLAMRAGMLLDALASVAAMHVVVVPVSGAVHDPSWTLERARTFSVVEPVGPGTMREHSTRQVADAELRARLERTAPLPARVLFAPPTLAPAVSAAAPNGRADAVLVMRVYLAPLGVRAARELAARRVVIDADDDDAALLLSLGDEVEAEAFDRLVACWLPDADAVLAASPVDAMSIAARAGLAEVTVVPNAVHVPDAVTPPPGADRLLFVGNLTYEPNVVAARSLAAEILPRVREHRPQARLDLVGPHLGALDDLAALPGVRLHGEVPDVEPFYAEADVVVVPLRHGSGTRIKVIEAFAQQRPVVATAVAVTGLDVEHDEAVIADTVDDLARGVVQILAEPDRARDMVKRAERLVRRRYAPEVVHPLVRAVVLGTSA